MTSRTPLEVARAYAQSGHPSHPGMAACPECSLKVEDGHKPDCDVWGMVRALEERESAVLVGYQYRYSDPFSGDPVWVYGRSGEWNGQRPAEARALYRLFTPTSLPAEDENF